MNLLNCSFIIIFNSGNSFCFESKTFIINIIKIGIYCIKFILMVFIFLNYFYNEMYFSMMFLTFSVCEGTLGLSLLVSMIRSHGNDYFNSFSILQC
uniref:NADH-ubiquinone oxidoreductase chain 4L n=1 Tax=Tinda javana TaxID=931524 RepID=A0A7S8FJ81_9DIPT|nr:NADH dehydrogenase subunit 4L [Tinda javana]QPD06990.1 NADH dehydrogenase subunit 4L [Tinda javana]